MTAVESQHRLVWEKSAIAASSPRPRDLSLPLVRQAPPTVVSDAERSYVIHEHYALNEDGLARLQGFMKLDSAFFELFFDTKERLLEHAEIWLRKRSNMGRNRSWTWSLKVCVRKDPDQNLLLYEEWAGAASFILAQLVAYCKLTKKEELLGHIQKFSETDALEIIFGYNFAAFTTFRYNLEGSEFPHHEKLQSWIDVVDMDNDNYLCLFTIDRPQNEPGLAVVADSLCKKVGGHPVDGKPILFAQITGHRIDPDLLFFAWPLSFEGPDFDHCAENPELVEFVVAQIPEEKRQIYDANARDCSLGKTAYYALLNSRLLHLRLQGLLKEEYIL